MDIGTYGFFAAVGLTVVLVIGGAVVLRIKRIRAPMSIGHESISAMIVFKHDGKKKKINNNINALTIVDRRVTLFNVHGEHHSIIIQTLQCRYIIYIIDCDG